jgi:hypothetical protein
MRLPVGRWYQQVEDFLDPEEGIALEAAVPHIDKDSALQVTAAFKAGQAYKRRNHEVHGD